RHARGERLTRGLVNERWEVRRDGALLWGDALHLANEDGGDIAATIADPACFAGAAACATLILAPPVSAPNVFLDEARAIQARCTGGGMQGGATVMNGL